MQVSYRQETDQALERLAAAGSGDAFGELYDRHFERVYDFVYRMVRDADEAADLAQETFVRAMKALKPEPQEASFTTWLFTIARNLALTRIGKLKRSTPLIDAESWEDDEPASGAVVHVVDESRLGDPESAARASDLAKLVWDAVAYLNPKESSILDLHLRRGLESAEIAKVLGISKGNAYTILSRLKDTLEEAVVTLVMVRTAREKCAELDQLLASQSGPLLSPAVRRLVIRHVDACPTCQEQRKRLLSPASLFGAFAMVPIPFGLRQRVAEALGREWSTSGPKAANPAGETAGQPAPPGPGERIGDLAARLGRAASRSVGNVARLVRRMVRDVTVTWPYRTGRWRATFLAVILLVAIFLIGGGGFLVREGTAASAGGGPTTVLGEIETPVPPSPTPTARPSPTPSPTPAPTPTPVSTPSPTPEPAFPDTQPPPPALVPTITSGTVVLPPSTWCLPVDVQLTGSATEDPGLATALTNATNSYRAAQGLSPLAPDSRLLKAARQHALFVVRSRWWTEHAGDVTIHCDAAGLDHRERAVAAGYPLTIDGNLVWIGENVAWGAVGRPTDQIFADILAGGEDPADPRFRHVGIACYTRASPSEYACVQVLAG
jgi:RNA polymerase sigma factor (sigma-70 family)